MEESVQLASISVIGLFGLYNHHVEMRREDRVTILHGPNGIGKTVILRLIHAFFQGRNEVFLDTSFREFAIRFSDGRSVTIRRTFANIADDEVKRVLEITSGSDNAPHRWTRDRAQYKRMAEYIDGDVPYITRIDEEEWSDDRSGETYTLSELVHRFQEVLPEKLKIGISEDPGWLRGLRTSISVHLVETQRLFLPDTDPDVRRFRPRRIPARRAFASTVETYSSDLRTKMAGALTTYAEHSQALDRSFPQRMLGGPKTETLDTKNLKDRMNKLEQRRSQLKKIGLIEDDTSYPFDINTLDSATPMQKAVMTLYVEDTENKLGVLDELEEKVDLLLGNINRKLRPNKHLRADRGSGLIVRDKRNLRIDLDSLSSGEQHELVLIYGLLFQVKPQSLVLIDEPELSLHVTWQKAFLVELFAIIRSVGFDVLIATHSPFIVSDRLDLMVPLAMDATEMDNVQQPLEQRVSE